MSNLPKVPDEKAELTQPHRRAAVAPDSGRRRPAAREAAKAKRQPSRAAFVIIGATLFIVGALVGIVAVRLRDRSRTKEVVAAVNGETITRDRFYRKLEATHGSQVIRTLVGNELIRQYARQLGVLPTDAEVQKEIDRLKKDPKVVRNISNGSVDMNDLRKDVEALMASIAVTTRGITITDREVQDFYRRNTDKDNPAAMFYTPPTATIQAIVTSTEQKAKQALRDINTGKSFQAAVSLYSEDQSKANGGFIGPFPQGRTLARRIQGLEKTIFGMRIGDQVGPLKMGGVYWIIRCVDKTAAKEIPKLADVRSEAEKWTKYEKGAKKKKELTAAYNEFSKSARVQAFWPKYADALKQKQ